MEAKELMIGDWVHIASPVKGRPEYNTQVYGIGPDVILVKKDSGADPIDLDRATPIPLTAEILAANGMLYGRDILPDEVQSDIDFMMPKEWEGGHTQYIHIYTNPHGVDCWHYELLTVTRAWIRTSFKYVHELQHALRLCGLNELADNFKI